MDRSSNDGQMQDRSSNDGQMKGRSSNDGQAGEDGQKLLS